MSILLRCRFSSARLRFDSKILFLSARGRGDFRRRAFSRCAISAACRLCRACSTASSNRSRASLRFCACERESCTVTLIPLGRCSSVTAVETLFTFCPPGPDDLAKVSFRSLSRNPSRVIRVLIDLSIDNQKSTQTGAIFSRPCRSTRAIQISSFKNLSTRRM